MIRSSLFNHVLIVADENSSVTYVENYLSRKMAKSVANIITEVIVKIMQKFPMVQLIICRRKTAYVNRRGVANDERIEWALGQMNDGNTVSENWTNLIGNSSLSDAKTVTIGRGEQRQNFTVRIVHYGKHSDGSNFATWSHER